jgi:hypothetical protein
MARGIGGKALYDDLRAAIINLARHFDVDNIVEYTGCKRRTTNGGTYSRRLSKTRSGPSKPRRVFSDFRIEPTWNRIYLRTAFLRCHPTIYLAAPGFAATVQAAVHMFAHL